MKTTSRQFKNKDEFIAFIKHQTNVELVNDKEHPLNKKTKWLYTKISGVYANSILRILNKYGMRYESHLNDNYWVQIK